jgi:DNA-directed RNA polymerase specialized sigma24 family protein
VTPATALPEGVDDTQYERIRVRMHMSVLKVWKSDQVIAGMDPWSVVDEAWISMAESGFRSAGPFLPFALAVARNKAIDALNRAEARRRDRSLHAPISAADPSEGFTLADVVPGSAGADDDYFSAIEHERDVERLVLVNEAIFTVLEPGERDVFLSVRVDGKSGAAVGRDLDSPVSGQRVGQIVAAAASKIKAYIDEHDAKENA